MVNHTYSQNGTNPPISRIASRLNNTVRQSIDAGVVSPAVGEDDDLNWIVGLSGSEVFNAETAGGVFSRIDWEKVERTAPI